MPRNQPLRRVILRFNLAGYTEDQHFTCTVTSISEAMEHLKKWYPHAENPKCVYNKPSKLDPATVLGLHPNQVLPI